jgi:hypothetical protein
VAQGAQAAFDLELVERAGSRTKKSGLGRDDASADDRASVFIEIFRRPARAANVPLDIDVLNAFAD